MNIRDMTREDLLNAIGLETRRSSVDYLMPALGIFGAGILVGAGIGLLFAPKSGRELRGDLQGRYDELRGKVDGEIEQAARS